jgi:hypothetical protein
MANNTVTQLRHQPGTAQLDQKPMVNTEITGLKGTIYNDRVFNQIVLTLTSVPITTVDNATVNYGNVKLLDFPVGLIKIVGTTASLALLNNDTGIDSDAAGAISIGTTVATVGNTVLSGTEANILASNAFTFVSNAATVAAKSSANITALTDSSGGTASDTLAAITGSYVEATIENTIASLAAKINALIGQASGEVVLSGESTAADAYLNLVAATADADAAGIVYVTGTIVITYVNLGDI